jgi:hypothetical protein
LGSTGSVTKKYMISLKLQNNLMSHVLWDIPIISALGKLRQDFTDSLSYTGRTCLKNSKSKQNKTNNFMDLDTIIFS